MAKKNPAKPESILEFVAEEEAQATTPNIGDALYDFFIDEYYPRLNDRMNWATFSDLLHELVGTALWSEQIAEACTKVRGTSKS